MDRKSTVVFCIWWAGKQLGKKINVLKIEEYPEIINKNNDIANFYLKRIDNPDTILLGIACSLRCHADAFTAQYNSLPRST